MIKGFITYDDLEKMVEGKLKKIGIAYDDYPLNPYQLIINEGITLQEVPLENEDIRGMIVHGENATGIVINKNRSFVSKKFIAMHELSHHWFHPHEMRMVCLDSYIDSNKAYEWQANNAASIALVPKQLLWDYYSIYRGNIKLIANFFGVSSYCIKYRLDKNKNAFDNAYTKLISVSNNRKW